MGLSTAATSLLWHGLAASTCSCASSSVTTFRTFCAFTFGLTIPCLLASGLQLLEWLGSMSTKHHPFHSAKHELSHLHSHHVNLGLTLNGFGCSHLERALCGYKHLHGM
ncbi:hypothetical protein NDA11_000543 [Ustilago hordei]|nr:hypothetical protein NDA10_000648 [Ustilago hordei]KAJ1570516.1 hypothetical protein NDA11_000543 [Ustilago hordei]KAJ1586970.1 hypothetical protein NDA15_000583 [Ustilago hordei]KAJ1589865.1 hypothetical protein NDA12_001740 [Ustilago hordei]UTT97019.1 hypothetical protein NDA17_007223 [Ustilago hordei]